MDSVSEVGKVNLDSTGMPNYVRLGSGVKFYLDNPFSTRGVFLADLVVTIAEICRYNFHLHSHYSVAEHCYHCSYKCSNPLYGLLHDLSEAIIGDVPAPIKRFCPDYKRIETQVEDWIYKAFGLDGKVPADLKPVDMRMLATEQMHFGRQAETADKFPAYSDVRIACWKPTYAALRYLERLQQLSGNKYTLDTVLECKE